jgi:transcriptional regulator GlxA family with amidase domain
LTNAIITDEKGIYTCGGGYSYLNLLLYIIEKHVGREMSILASKMFEIDIERKSQNPFMIFVGQKKHGDETVLQSQEFIENNPTATFTVDAVCDKFNVGRRTFERKFRKCTGNSIAEYIQRVKVEFAKKHLEAGRKTVNEIIYETGYNDIDAFRKVFKKFTDLSPIDYRKKFAV